MNNDNAEATNCSHEEDSCKFEHSKNVESERGCFTHSTGGDYDIEFRFNEIEDMESAGSDTAEKAWKLYYLCRRNSCNSSHFIDQVSSI
jgi:hypothetical protein